MSTNATFHIKSELSYRASANRAVAGTGNKKPAQGGQNSHTSSGEGNDGC
jgi:hypothetical protein